VINPRCASINRYIYPVDILSHNIASDFHGY